MNTTAELHARLDAIRRELADLVETALARQPVICAGPSPLSALQILVKSVEDAVRVAEASGDPQLVSRALRMLDDLDFRTLEMRARIANYLAAEDPPRSPPVPPPPWARRS